MAYIDWWNRTGPITLGERFGLNEISIARNTLSPTKSYIDGGRIGFDKGGGVKILEYLEGLDIAEGAQISMEDVMKYAKDNKIKIGHDSISVNIYNTDRKIGGKGSYKDNYVLKEDIRNRWNAVKHKVKVKHKIFDAKNPGPVFEQLDILLADKTKYPTQTSILKELGYTVQESKKAGRSGLKRILEAYAKDRNITIPADRFPLGSYGGTQIATDIISNYKTGKFTIADLARNYFPNKAHNDAKMQVNAILKDAGVRDPSEFRKWPGDKPEKWKKVRKERVKNLVKRVGIDTAAQTLSLEKQILAKNADILKMTDDEIWNNKKIQKSMNLDVKDLTKKNGTLKFDRYTEFLADGKTKNPRYLNKAKFVAKVKAMAAPNSRIFWQPEHMAGIATEKLHAMFPNEIQAASGKIGSQMDALRAYLKANPNGKAVPEIKKLLNEFNMQIKIGEKTYGFKEKIKFTTETGKSNIVEAGLKIHDKGVKTLSETMWGTTKEVGKKGLKGFKWVAEKLAPIMLPGPSHILHGGKYDLTSGSDLSTMAFWKHAADWTGKTSKLGDATIPLKKRLKDLAWRGLLPTRFLPLISGAASVAAGPMLIKDAAEWLQGRLEKKELTGKGGIADYAGIISDEAGGSLFIEDVVKEKQKQAAEGMDYAQGGIASLIK